MALKTIDLDIADNGGVTQTVESRTDWADTWSDHSATVFCRAARWTTNPEMPSATLHYRYGSVDIAKAGTFTTYKRAPPISRGDFVKLTFVGHEILAGTATAGEKTASKTKIWFGVATTIDDDDNGSITITCAGLEKLLTEKNIDQSVWFVDQADGTTAKTISQVLTFNQGNVGNRSTNKLSSKHYGFSGYKLFTDPTGNEKWSTRDIVEYVAATQTPVDDSGTLNIPFELDDSGGVLPDYDSPEVNPEGQKAKSFIDSLITRSRGLGYFLEVDETATPDTIKIKPFTYASQDIDLPITSPPNQKIPQNPNRYIFLTSGFQAGSILVQINNESRFDRVRVVGGRAVYCFSLSGPDGNLVEKWKSNLKTAYDEAASTDGGYPGAAEIADREVADNVARSHVMFRNVYSRFGVKVDDPDHADHWSGQVKNGENGGTANYALPEPDSDPVTGQDFYPPNFRFIDQLPLLKNYDYEGGTTPTVRTDEDDEIGERYLSSLSFFKRVDDASKWIEGNKISTLANTERSEYDFSIEVAPDQNEPAFYVQVIGQPQHMIAPITVGDLEGKLTSRFSPLAYEAEYFATKSWNYCTAIFTVAAYGNDYCEATVGEASPIADMVRTKRIDVGDRFQKHHVADGTVVGVNEATGALKRRSAAGFVRDDSEQVEAVAEFAYLWYSLDRATLRISTNHFGDFELGAIVASLTDGIAATFNATTNRVSITGGPYASGEAVVFYLEDSAVLPAPLTPGQIYYLTSTIGSEYAISYRIDGPEIDLTDAGSGNAFATNSGANTPITSVELALPVTVGSETAGLAETLIQTGNSEFDVRNFV